jgi:hypothetical protein
MMIKYSFFFTSFDNIDKLFYQGGVFRPRILYLRSTLNVESENISIDYDSTKHVFETIAKTLFIYTKYLTSNCV